MHNPTHDIERRTLDRLYGRQKLVCYNPNIRLLGLILKAEVERVLLRMRKVVVEPMVKIHCSLSDER